MTDSQLAPQPSPILSSTATMRLLASHKAMPHLRPQHGSVAASAAAADPGTSQAISLLTKEAQLNAEQQAMPFRPDGGEASQGNMNMPAARPSAGGWDDAEGEDERTQARRRHRKRVARIVVDHWKWFARDRLKVGSDSGCGDM